MKKSVRQLYQPRFKCALATCSQWLPYRTDSTDTELFLHHRKFYWTALLRPQSLPFGRVGIVRPSPVDRGHLAYRKGPRQLRQRELTLRELDAQGACSQLVGAAPEMNRGHGEGPAKVEGCGPAPALRGAVDRGGGWKCRKRQEEHSGSTRLGGEAAGVGKGWSPRSWRP